MQTISFFLFRLQESGLGSQDILSEKPWKLTKKKLESFLHQGKKATCVFFVLIIRFRQLGAEIFFIYSFSIFFIKVVQNHLKREKN